MKDCEACAGDSATADEAGLSLWRSEGERSADYRMDRPYSGRWLRPELHSGACLLAFPVTKEAVIHGMTRTSTDA